jgi:beta-lactamase superfamily II metal-dependent hydrolase
MVLLTHRHADHLGGLAKVIEACGTRLFMDGGAAHPSAQYNHLLKVIEDRRVPFRQATAGRSIDLGAGATLFLLGPPEPLLVGEGGGVNGNSVVSRLVVGKTSMLFTGDAEKHEEAWLLAGHPALRSTVLKLGHHGSRTSSSAAFLAAVAPDLAVVSCKPGDAKHPHPETLKRLERTNLKLVRTSDEGNIVLGFFGDRVSLESSAHPERTWIP